MSAFDGYVQAAFHGGVMRGGPTFTVVHDAETPLRPGYCDSIADFFRRGPKAGTSAHAMVGPEKALKLLPDDVVAYAAGPYANPYGWHLEQTGYAAFDPEDWVTADGLAQVDRVGGCLAEVHDTWGIPKRWMTDDQLRRAAKGDRSSGGIATHKQVARVLRGTTHTDPEENYPRDLLLVRVLGRTVSPPALTPDQIEEIELMSARDDILAAIAGVKATADTAAARALQGRPAALIQDDVPGSPTRGTIWSIGPGGAVALASADEMRAQQNAGLAGELVYVTVSADLAALKRLNGIPS